MKKMAVLLAVYLLVTILFFGDFREFFIKTADKVSDNDPVTQATVLGAIVALILAWLLLGVVIFYRTWRRFRRRHGWK